IFEFKTVAALVRARGSHAPNAGARAAAIVRTGRDAGSCLVCLHPGRELVPLFLVHAATGTVGSYIDLARHLGGPPPVIAIRSPALGGPSTPPETVAAMAGLYTDAIRTVWPLGPLLLGGWSFGGLVAFEMARILEGQGQEVKLLALIDAVLPEV